MKYPDMKQVKALVEQLELYAQLKTEYGAAGTGAPVRAAEAALRRAVVQLKGLRNHPRLAAKEPDGLAAIRALRPAGPRRFWFAVDRDAFAERMAGALLGRMAGCTLGAPVEGWTPDRMRALAEENGEPFPPVDYWRYVHCPATRRYGVSRIDQYVRGGIRGVPVDDDVVYTLLGLLIMEEYGRDFTTADVGRAWLKYLPHACTAERVALANLRRGVPAGRAATVGNPYCEWIGADIRADPWGYVAPGWPERAAELAWRDARISHRRQGVYGEMFFAAAVSAAFAVDDPVAAIRIGLTEIPRDCALAQAVRWALRVAPRVRNWKDAYEAANRQFAGMHMVHTINNACLTVWGLTIGGTDFSRVITETVAMGYDNDCTAATAGSMAGAVVGRRGIPARWYRPFGNTIHTYLIGRERFAISDVLRRFQRQALAVQAS